MFVRLLKKTAKVLALLVLALLLVGIAAIPLARWEMPDDLIAADARPAVGDPTCGVFRQRKRYFAGIDDHEVVAQPVHLGEGPRAHGPGYRGLRAGKSMKKGSFTCVAAPRRF